MGWYTSGLVSQPEVYSEEKLTWGTKYQMFKFFHHAINLAWWQMPSGCMTEK
jgi:hypothetical protein